MIRSTTASATVLATALALVGPAYSQASPNGPAATGGLSVQQSYESADAKIVAGQTQAGLDEFRALERRLAGTPASPNLALTRIGIARALENLNDRDGALAAADAALGSGALEREALVDSRVEALRLRARLREATLDHAGAAADHHVLLTLAQTDIERLAARVGGARTSIFVDPDRALSDIDAAAALLATLPDAGKDAQAAVMMLKGRILLNRGEAAEGRTVLREAMRMQGGLTQRATFGQIELRGDMALAHLRNGDEEAAREVFAYTGSGRGETILPRPNAILVPQCGDDGTTPEDSVVVQFSIGTDGRVTGAQPVLSTRTGDMPLAFARQVNQWEFNPVAVASLPNYMQFNSRVELHCTNKAQRRSELTGISDQRMAWLTAGGFEPATEWGPEYDEALIANLARSGLSDQQRIGALASLATSASVGGNERRAYRDQLAAEVARVEIPAPVRLSILIQNANTLEWGMTSRRAKEHRAEAIAALGARAEFAADPQLRTIIRLSHAGALEDLRDTVGTARQLEAIVSDTAVEQLDPLRVAALIDLANLRAREGRYDLAAAAYDQTGLSAQQCALIDGGPRLIRTNINSNIFPPAAQRYGFEGWTSVEYDVGADGRTKGMRVVASYPPRIFGSATLEGVGRMRYEETYRPGGDPGCVATQQHFSFQLPR